MATKERQQKDIEDFLYLQELGPKIGFDFDSLYYSIQDRRGTIIYETLTKPQAEAIFEAHSLLGWTSEYEELLPYLTLNYPYLFV